MDIVLVVLIIFLISATVMMPHNFSIALPKAGQADKLDRLPIIVSLDREGRIAINGTKLCQDEEFAAVFQSQQKSPDTFAVIAADKETRHGRPRCR